MIFTYDHVTFNRVVDGDTISFDVDLGFGVIKRDIRVRVAGIDTPETRGDERIAGVFVKEIVEQFFIVFKARKYKFKLRVVGKPKSFNRAIAEVLIFNDNDSFRVSLSDWLVHKKLAVVYGEDKEGLLNEIAATITDLYDDKMSAQEYANEIIP